MGPFLLLSIDLPTVYLPIFTQPNCLFFRPLSGRPRQRQADLRVELVHRGRHQLRQPQQLHQLLRQLPDLHAQGQEVQGPLPGDLLLQGARIRWEPEFKVW